MKTIAFRQHDKQRQKILFLVWMILLIALTVIVVSGPQWMLETLNNAGKTPEGLIIVSMTVVVVLIAPLLAIQRLTASKARVQIDDRRLSITTKRGQTVIELAQIEKITLNKEGMNTMAILGKADEPLYVFRAGSNPRSLLIMLDPLLASTPFAQSIERIKAIGGYNNAVIYTRLE